MPHSDWNDLSHEISHCALLRAYLENKWPTWETYTQSFEQEEESESSVEDEICGSESESEDGESEQSED